MFALGSHLCRLLEFEGELTMACYNEANQQWRAVHLPSALRTHALRGLSLAPGPTSLFILSRPEQKVYRVQSDMSVSKRIAFVNIDAMHNQLNDIAQINGSYYIMGFSADMRAYLIDTAQGGRILTLDTSRLSLAVSASKPSATFPSVVSDLRLLSVQEQLYAVVHFNQTSCALFHVSTGSSDSSEGTTNIATGLTVHTGDQLSKLLYTFSVNSNIVAVFRSSTSGGSTSDGYSNGTRSNAASFTLSVSSSRFGSTISAVVFRIQADRDSVKTDKKGRQGVSTGASVTLVQDVPDSFSRGCIYYNGRLQGFDGLPLPFEPLEKVLFMSSHPTPFPLIKTKPAKEAPAFNDSFSLNISEISHNSGHTLVDSAPQVGKQIFTQSIGFGNERDKYSTKQPIIFITDEIQAAYEYLNVPIDTNNMTVELLTQGFISSVARLQAVETAISQENASMRKEITVLIDALNQVKANSASQTEICTNLNGIIDTLRADNTDIRSSLSKLESGLSDLARQQLMLATKPRSSSTVRQQSDTGSVPAEPANEKASDKVDASGANASVSFGGNVPEATTKGRLSEKDLTASDIATTSMDKKKQGDLPVAATTAAAAEVPHYEVRDTKTSSATTQNTATEPEEQKPLSYRDVEKMVQRTLRSLTPTHYTIHAPPQPVLCSTAFNASRASKMVRSRAETDMALLREESEIARRKSVTRALSTSILYNSIYNTNNEFSPSSMAERLRMINKKMSSSLGRAKRIEQALDTLEKENIHEVATSKQCAN